MSIRKLKPSPNNMKDEFKGYASRMTAPREAILGFMRRSMKHMSAKEIYASIHKEYPGIGLSTVYRTLDLLARMGVVTKLNLGDGQNRYEFKSQENNDHHHHLICTQCGRIINYCDFAEEELSLIKKTEKKLSQRFSFLIEDHNIEYLGICDRCR
jgi:Fur family ferric uptake transcriptional regulator